MEDEKTTLTLNAWKIATGDVLFRHRCIAYSCRLTRFTLADPCFNPQQIAESISLLQQWATDQRLGSREARHLSEAIEKFESSDSVLRGQQYRKIIALETKMRQLTTSSRDNTDVLDFDLKHLLSLQPLTTVEKITLHLINIFRRNMDRFTGSKLSSLLMRPSVSSAFLNADEKNCDNDAALQDDIEKECVKLIREALVTFPAIRDCLTLLHDVWCALVDLDSEPARPLQVELATHGHVFNVDVLSIISHLAKGPTQFYLYDLATILSPALFNTSIHTQNDAANRLHVVDSSVDALSRIMQFNARASTSSSTSHATPGWDSDLKIPSAKYVSIFDSPLLAIPSHLLESWYLEIASHTERAKEFLDELVRWYDVELWLLTALLQYCLPLQNTNLTWGEFIVHRHIFHQVTVLLSLMYGRSETLPNLFWFSRCNSAIRNHQVELMISEEDPIQFDTLQQLLDWLDADLNSPLPYRIHVSKSHPSLKKSNYDSAEELQNGRLLSSTELNCRLDQPIPAQIGLIWKTVATYIRTMIERRQVMQVTRLVAWIHSVA